MLQRHSVKLWEEFDVANAAFMCGPGCAMFCDPTQPYSCVKQDMVLKSIDHMVGRSFEPGDERYEAAMLDTIENFVRQQDNTELSLHFQLKHASGPFIICCGPMCCSDWTHDKLDWQKRPEGMTSATEVPTQPAEMARA